MELNATKAFITKLPTENDNSFKVRVPIMEDSTGNEAIFNALLCTSPSSYGGYSVGDCVYVLFEDDKYDQCVIIGKLFTEIPKDSSAFVIANELKITGNASLPPSTKLGDYTAQDLTNLYNSTAGGGGGGGTINDDDLKDYVKYVKQEREDGDYFAKKIRCMNGTEYSEMYAKAEEEGDLESLDNTLYFLTSIPEDVEISYDEGEL